MEVLSGQEEIDQVARAQLTASEAEGLCDEKITGVEGVCGVQTRRHVTEERGQSGYGTCRRKTTPYLGRSARFTNALSPATGTMPDSHGYGLR